MNGKILPDVHVPSQVLAEAGVDLDCKLDCEVDPESGEICVVEVGYRYDLTDVPPDLLDMFRECGIYLDDLEINEPIAKVAAEEPHRSTASLATV